VAADAMIRVATLTASALLLVACSSTPTSSSTSTAHATMPGPSVPTTPLLSVPHNFAEACHFEPQACVPDANESVGDFPADLRRPLAVPTLPAGGSCPVSPVQRIVTEDFVGMAVGSGAVRPAFFLDSFDAARGVPPGTMRPDGWFDIKTLWFAVPAYTGPARVRTVRLDGPGSVAFGESPDLGELVFPDGPTLNQGPDGYRQIPGATWVRSAGCYAWQVDGIGFSTVIVFRVAAT
jgi:hypothetical protein